MTMDTPRTPRVLTHDERKAAEAAFLGRPCNSAWSESAKRVYEGLTNALPALPGETIVTSEAQSIEAAPTLPTAKEPNLHGPIHSDDAPEVRADVPNNQLITNRRQAIQAGFLIDVSTDAHKLGLTFSVTVTKPLWEVGIAPGESISEEEKAQRLRDVLMAFRLRIASQTTLSPLIDFPAMLALPPGGVPQPVPLFALIQPDEENRAATIIPMN
jgi:hypothetical protein